ncbi:MAG: SRPBCC family protein [Micromonosporaceae bacterium]
MAPFVSHIEIDRPPAEVFDYATDPSRFAEWQSDVVRVKIEDGNPPVVGARFITTRKLGGTMTQQVTESDPPRHWAVRGVAGPIRPHVSITVAPLDDGARSRVTFSLDFEGHGVGKPLVPLVVRAARKGAPASYQNLKQRLEAGRVSAE